ncbi:LLM class flavin-dependent oxidoreductase [Streptacidiphilus neutrinimicus]|uniref:LLM class flavin-dependent oxidoreductase n=1 Tax=Streptacidiphilus neutrinimicus TaxID=105420 RepID=UPI0005A7FBB7|nr:LLM class flavin-dependent oxidoreductase [Streptacidiphilus neutrinimicus]
MNAPLKLSLLDRSVLREGQTAAQALRDTVALARYAEELGYHRFWVSEHHGVPGIAGSAPTVLAAAVAGATSRIRVGTGGVMLPNHRPLVVAEQFAVLGSLFPGRIDMGLGRSVGFTRAVQEALGHTVRDADDFPEQLAELLDLMRGGSERRPGVRVHPADGPPVPPFVLALGAGARIAAEAGLPVVVGGVHDRARLLAAVTEYRDAFKPSPWRDEPYLVVAAPVAVGGTAEEAREMLAAESWSLAQARTLGAFPPLSPPEAVRTARMTARQRTHVEQARAGHLAGTEAEVRTALDELVATTGADEILVTASAYDPARLRASLAGLARVGGLEPRG